MSEPKYLSSCVERFLQYVKIDTQSDGELRDLPQHGPGSCRSSSGWCDELKELGIDDADDGRARLRLRYDPGHDVEARRSRRRFSLLTSIPHRR